MPNLKPPVTTTARALEYREEILRALPPGSSFNPLMTLYLTDTTSPEEIKIASTDSLSTTIGSLAVWYCVSLIVACHVYFMAVWCVVGIKYLHLTAPN